MPSQKRLQPVCHNFAHHSASALSFLHPHLAQAVRASGKTSADVDMLQLKPFPAGIKPLKTVEYAFSALRKRFDQMLAAEKFSFDDLAALLLRFDFSKTLSGPDDHCVCHALIVSKEGNEFRESVDSIGSGAIRDQSLGNK